jgi:DNA polymerase III epsilon subunit family exonuclease
VIVALDLEATGFSSSVEHVIEIGAVKFRGADVLGRFHTLVNPGLRLPPIIKRLTGIGDDDLRAAPRLADVLPELRTFIGDHDLLAHGAGYDAAFLHEVLGEQPGQREVFDSIDVARVVLPTAASYGLAGLCDAVGLQHPRPHHALEDAEATFRLFLALARLAHELHPALLQELRELTSGESHSLRTFFHEFVAQRDLTADTAAPGSERPPGTRTPAAELETASGRTAPALAKLDPDQLVALLGPTGPLASEPGWELREAQQEMCRSVAQAFERRMNLVVEAGPGTGKSLAYLVPALAWAASRREPVCVSTYTINLQEQLLHKDLPLAARILGIPLHAVLLKGRRHYLSKVRWAQLLVGTRHGAMTARGLEGIDAAELLIFKLKITVWLTLTTTGDRDELRLFGQEERIWRAVASEWGGDCASPDCVDGPQPCFYHLSRRRAAAADVLVVNHALLLADALREVASLPAASHLIIDEAHHLEEAASRGLTEEAREDDLLALLSLVGSAGGTGVHGPSSAVRRVADRVFAIFDALRSACVNATGSDAGRDLLIGADSDTDLRDARQHARRLRADMESLSETEMAVVGSRLTRALDILLGSDAESEAPRESIAWVSFNREGRGALKCAPLDVAPIVREALFEDRASVVLTSATLSVGGTFDYFRSRVGLPASRLSEMVLDSPFDFLHQALLCLPDDVEPPPQPGFEARLIDVVERVARALDGHTLVLFTSSEQLAAVSATLRQRLAPDGIAVLAQGGGGGTRRTLTERFAANPEAVLCGTNSFWEGVDLPATALRCVVIVRLPFRSPGDPLVRARSVLLRDPFVEMALPEAVLRLKQGFGRLIRRSTDRGAVVILDNRVTSRRYGQHFIAALPRCATFVGPSAEIPTAIREWIGDRRPADLDQQGPRPRAAISFSNGSATRTAPARSAGAARSRTRKSRRQYRAPPRPG